MPGKEATIQARPGIYPPPATPVVAATPGVAT